MDYPIDAVICWVDGNDPAHRAKRMKYATGDQLADMQVGGDTRYTSVGEINYCVASLLRFAPFLRKIFIVTDAQDPQLDGFLDRNFPDRRIPVEIVDHSAIFRGYERVLPTFSSRAVETMVWRIPDLSEHYIYLNDDFVLVRPTSPGDYFDEEGRAVCYAWKFSVPFARLLRAMKPGRRAHKVGFKDGMLNAADVLGCRRWFPYIGHIPQAMRKSVLSGYFFTHPDVLEGNIAFRFRSFRQFNPQELHHILGLRSGASVMRPRKGVDLYLKPKNKEGYVAGKLREFDESQSAMFACFNSLDLASASDRRLCLDWLRRRLDLLE